MYKEYKVIVDTLYIIYYNHKKVMLKTKKCKH